MKTLELCELQLHGITLHTFQNVKIDSCSFTRKGATHKHKCFQEEQESCSSYTRSSKALRTSKAIFCGTEVTKCGVQRVWFMRIITTHNLNTCLENISAVAIEFIALLLRIQEVLDSTLDPETAHPHWRFLLASSASQEIAEIVGKAKIRPRPFPSTFFQIQCSPIILPFYAIESELLITAWNKP
jgi:hypothetical protein